MKPAVSMLRAIALGLFVFMTVGIQASSLKGELQKFVRDKKAQIGIAVVSDGKVIVSLNDNERYPMMSVYKFHQSMAVAELMERNNIPLDSALYISKKDLKENTYSPLRDSHPAGNFHMPIRELLKYSLQQSDNNACDILFQFSGGPQATNKYIRSLGYKQFNIQYTEDEMHQDIALCYQNWSSPSDAALLIYDLFNNRRFAGKHFAYIRECMEQCQTGTDRLAAPFLATNAVVGHKTGTGGKNENGAIIGVNDVAHIKLPDGKRYAIAVLIKDSLHDMAETGQMIAEISRLVFAWACKE